MKKIILEKYSCSIFIMLMLFTPTTVFANENTVNPEKVTLCVSCHGAEGISPHNVWPNIAGRNKTYLIQQLHFFRSNKRVNPWMSPIAKMLSDKDIDELADYFSSLPENH